MAGWEFLSGLLSGVGDTYQRASEENRRISLLKKQIDISQANAIADRDERALDRQSRKDLADKTFDLQKTVELGRLGLDWSKLDASEREAAKGRAHDIYTMGIQNALQRGNMTLAEQLKQDSMRFGWVLGRVEADDDVKRKVSLMKTQAGIEEQSQKNLLAERTKLDRETAAIRDTAELDMFRKKESFAFSKQLIGNAIERGQATEDERVALEQKAHATAIEAEAAGVGGGNRVMAFYRTLGNDIAEAKKKGQQIPAKAMQALRILEESPNAQASANAIMSLIGPEGSDDFSKVSKVGAAPGGKIDLTQKPTSQTGASEQPRGNRDRNPNTLKADDLAKVFDDNPEFTKEYIEEYNRRVRRQSGETLGAIKNSYDYWMRGDERKKEIRNALLFEIQQAPGQGLGDRLDYIWQKMRAEKPQPIKMSPEPSLLPRRG